MAALFKSARQEMGGCNVLINNAGILRDRALVKKDKTTGHGVHGMSKEEWDSVIAVNLTGPFLAAREFAAGAIGVEQGGAWSSLARARARTRALSSPPPPPSRCLSTCVWTGVIVNISSSARNGYVFQSNYSAAKAGIAADTVVSCIYLARRTQCSPILFKKSRDQCRTPLCVSHTVFSWTAQTVVSCIHLARRTHTRTRMQQQTQTQTDTHTTNSN